MSGVDNGSYENVTIEDRDYSLKPFLYTDLDKVVISIIMPIVVTIGIIGNVLTIIVIVRKKCMHTSVYVYFANLAIADTLFLITVPVLVWNSYIKSPVIDLYDIGEVPNWLCPLNVFLISAGVDVALFTTFWLSVERYMAVCRPLKFKQSGFGIFSRSIKICGIIWFLGLSWNVYYLVSHRTDILDELSWSLIAGDNLPIFLTSCYSSWSVYGTIHWYVSRALSALMIVTIVALYTAMLTSLHKSQSTTASSAGRKPSKSEMKVFLTVFVTVTVYVLCTVPFFIYWSLLAHDIEVNLSLLNIFRLMGYINSSLNPVIYNAMHYKFRRAFCDLYCSRCNRKKNTPINQF